MSTTADIRRGLCMRFNNDIYKVVEFLHVKPGKGPAFVRTKLKSITTGRTLDNTFPSGHKIDEVRVETQKFQFLYSADEEFHFMNTEDYTQIVLQANAVDTPELMKEGEEVTILINAEDGIPLSMELPAHVILKVTQTEPGVRGNTATNATKPATVETGAEVNVPLFINVGDKIRVDTEKGQYQERVRD